MSKIAKKKNLKLSSQTCQWSGKCQMNSNVECKNMRLEIRTLKNDNKKHGKPPYRVNYGKDLGVVISSNLK